jgi:hypothetical protein
VKYVLYFYISTQIIIIVVVVVVVVVAAHVVDCARHCLSLYMSRRLSYAVYSLGSTLLH